MLANDTSNRPGYYPPWRRLRLLAAVALLALGLDQTASLAAAPKAAVGISLEVPGEVSIPAPLSKTDADLYRRIVALQGEAAWQAADKLVAGLKDRSLVGSILAARYLGARYKPSYGEIQSWLAAYSDQAPAAKLYRLVQKQRRPAGVPPLRAPANLAALSGNGDDDPALRDQAIRVSASRTVGAAEAKVRQALHKDNTVLAEHLLGGVADPVAVDAMKAEIAARLLADGRDAEALAFAAQAARSVKSVPEATWIAGLASWRLGKRDQAAKYFAATADSPAAVPATVAAASFWAGRAYMVTRQPAEWHRWMARAASNPYTFYGLLASRAIDSNPRFNWSLPEIGAGELQALRAFPGVVRALMLIQIGQREAAESELRFAVPHVPANLQPLLLTIAERGGLPGLATRLAGTLRKSGVGRYDAGLFPVPPWTPRTGFTLNRALIYAIMRQESRFNPEAQSPAGAVGLMQLMPGTAAHVERRPGTAQQRRERLRDPEINVQLAQRLIDELLGEEQVRGNLFRLAAAYNGGLGKLTRWQDRDGVRGADPLLFIESIPSPETRFFIEHILSNYWIYQTRFGQPTDGLDALAAGDWPIYTPDLGQVELAQRNGRN